MTNIASPCPFEGHSTTDGGILVGQIQRDNLGNVYEFVRLELTLSVSVSAGYALHRNASDTTRCTTDVSHALANGLFGVALAVLNPTYPYGWALIEGNPLSIGVTLKTDGGVAAGEVLYSDSDKVFKGVTVAVASLSLIHGIGIALTTDSGSLCTSASIGRGVSL